MKARPKSKKKSKILHYDSSNDIPLSLKNSKHIDFLNAQIVNLNGDVSRSDTEANSADRGLASQLILITTVLITANIVVFSNGELMKILTPDQKGMSILGCNMLILSLFFGIMHYALAKKFHTDWADAKSAVKESIAGGKVLTRGDITALIQEKIKGLSSQIKAHYLNLQIIFLALALLTYSTLTTSLLFNLQFKDLGKLIYEAWLLLTP